MKIPIDGSSKVARLPQWAQYYIRDLQRRADDAATALREAADGGDSDAVTYSRSVITGDSGGWVSRTFRIPEKSIDFRLGEHTITVHLRDHDSEPNLSIYFDAEEHVIIPRAGNVIAFVVRPSEWRRKLRQKQEVTDENA